MQLLDGVGRLRWKTTYCLVTSSVRTGTGTIVDITIMNLLKNNHFSRLKVHQYFNLYSKQLYTTIAMQYGGGDSHSLAIPLVATLYELSWPSLGSLAGRPWYGRLRGVGQWSVQRVRQSDMPRACAS